MNILPIIFLSFFSLISSFDVYIVPFNSRDCPTKQPPCDGSSTNPFDDLYYSFTYGVFHAQAASDTVLNFFLYGNNSTPGHLISLYYYSLMGGNGSPFEKYQGSLFDKS